MIDFKKLKSLRESASLTQTELAEKIGITQTHYSRLEKGLRGASQETIQAIIQALGVSISDIWDMYDLPATSDLSNNAPQCIIIEQGRGENKKRYILPATNESYQLLKEQMNSELNDHRLEMIISAWESSDEVTRNELFVFFNTLHEQKKAKK